jgi:hypothetical protein
MMTAVMQVYRQGLPDFLRRICFDTPKVMRAVVIFMNFQFVFKPLPI